MGVSLVWGLAWRMETVQAGGWGLGPLAACGTTGPRANRQTALGGRKEELTEHSWGHSSPDGHLAEAKW